jgi:hypothetical protein
MVIAHPGARETEEEKKKRELDLPVVMTYLSLSNMDRYEPQTSHTRSFLSGPAGQDRARERAVLDRVYAKYIKKKEM